MRHAYLVMAHNQWELLEELLSALDSSSNDIYLHIDKKVSFPKERLDGCCSKSKLIYTKRYNIMWGGTQMMLCTLQMLEEAQKGRYDYYHLISGTDFPLKSPAQINVFFESNPVHQFIGLDWATIKSGSAMFRVRYYHFFCNLIGKPNNKILHYRLLKKFEDYSLAVQSKLNINRVDYKMYKGSSWFSITHDAVMLVLENQTSIKKRFKFSLGADEIWLQTFLMNSNFSTQVIDSNMRYIKWVQGNPSPETLTMADYDDLIASDKLFARKFDWNKDAEVIKKLKEHISKG